MSRPSRDAAIASDAATASAARGEGLVPERDRLAALGAAIRRATATGAGPITPVRIFLEPVAQAAVAALAARTAAIAAEGGTTLVVGYSVKTNPRAELLACARDAGFLAEVISPDELAWAHACGFPASRTIYNGPHPPPLRTRSTAPPEAPLAVCFADSVDAFVRNARAGVAALPGVRLRPPGVASRFGVAPEELADLAAAVRETMPRGRPIGVSYHVRPQDYGGRSWLEIATAALETAQRLRERSEREVTVFDVGGGWTPSELHAALETAFPELLRRARAALPALERVVLEPGQSIATPCEAVLARVLEVRVRPPRRHEIVIDAGYPMLTQIGTFAHPIWLLRDGGDALEALSPAVGESDGVVLGPTCLEYDVVRRGVVVPAGVRAGDLVCVGDAGAYDASMAFRFARGAAVAGIDAAGRGLRERDGGERGAGERRGED